MAQYIMLPMTYVNVTQNENGNFSHKGINAIDLAGQDWNIDNVRAPVDMKIVAIYSYANMVIATSTKKVKFANGVVDYATFQFMHDNNISNLKVGKKIKQWKTFYQEGTTGFASGNHIHLAVKRGKFEGFKADGWSLKGAMNTRNAFVLVEGVHEKINQLGKAFKVKSKRKTSSWVAYTKFWYEKKDGTKRYIKISKSEYNRRTTSKAKYGRHIHTLKVTTKGRTLYNSKHKKVGTLKGTFTLRGYIKS